MRKSIIIIAISCIIGNGFVPRSITFFRQSDALSALMQSQPLVQCCNALSALPVMIVTTMLDNSAAPDSHCPPGKNESTTANTSAEFTLLSAGKSAPAGKQLLACIPHAGAFSAGGHPCLFSSGYFCRLFERVLDMAGVREGGILLFVMVLMFVMLPRGAINEHAVICRNAHYPIWSTSGLGFSFLRGIL